MQLIDFLGAINHGSRKKKGQDPIVEVFVLHDKNKRRTRTGIAVFAGV
jgi:hypothetical protein